MTMRPMPPLRGLALFSPVSPGSRPVLIEGRPSGTEGTVYASLVHEKMKQNSIEMNYTAFESTSGQNYELTSDQY